MYTGVQLDVHSMQVMQVYPYKDGTLGLDPKTHLFIGNPAHETVDPDGTLWSNVQVFQMPSMAPWYAFIVLQHNEKPLVLVHNVCDCNSYRVVLNATHHWHLEDHRLEHVQNG